MADGVADASEPARARSSYVEYAPVPALGGHVELLYVHEVRTAATPQPHLVVPDGRVDLLWGPASLYVAGPDTLPRWLALPAAVSFVGVRFRTGHAAAVLGVPISELRDRRLPVADLWGRAGTQIAEELCESTSGPAAAQVLTEALLRRGPITPPADPIIDPAVAWLRRARVASIPALAAHLGVSDRQLLRRSTAAVGYGPKRFHGVARLQRFLALAHHERDPSVGLDSLATRAGYADQAHLTRECRRLVGEAPAALLARRNGGADEPTWRFRSRHPGMPSVPSPRARQSRGASESGGNG